MPIKFQCAYCGAPIKAPDTHAGETLPCPKCGVPVLVMADPVPPPLASVPPAVAAPPPIGVFAVGEVVHDEVIPAIVTHVTEPIAPPELAFVATAPSRAEVFDTPTSRRSRATDTDLQDVRVVDVRLRWSTVF